MNSKSLLRSVVLLALLTSFFNFKILACGYSYISDCATTIDVELNGLTSTYQVSNCPYLTIFNNHNFGTVTTLNITKAKSQTWESCDNNVMNARLFYRIYPQTGTAGTFSSFLLPQLTTTVNGPYRNKSREGFPSLNLIAGLNAGNYFIEIYFESDVDFNNDGIANTQIKKDNNGSYFKASFSIPSGQGGSLTVTLVNKTDVTCNGSNNGSATVNVTNGTPPYTYIWSNGLTGPTRNNLAAGNYTVTATDAAGSTGSLNVFITQPSALLANLSSTNETSASANNGSAAAAPTGGTPPYTFNWSNGATTASINNLDSGNYSCTVTGANGCTAVSSVTIIVSGTTPSNYCVSTGNFPWVDWITRVKLNTINNTSDKSQYSNFTNSSTALNTGASYTVTLENGFSWETFNEYWRVWIDYNRNGIFEEPGEIAFSGILNAPPLGSPGGSTTGAIIVPATADEGTTRMRVAIKRGAYATPCETIPFGEVEDYTINIVNGGPVVCSINAAVSNILCNSNGTNTNPGDDTFTFSVLVNGTGTGSSWSTTIGGQNYTGSYGTAKTIGPLPISGGVVNFMIADTNSPTCTTAKSVTPPAPCSNTNPCAINATVSSPVCNNNGTPSNPADDTYTFNLTVTGTNTSAGWSTTILGTTQSGTYSAAKPLGPYPINAGILNFTVQDANSPNCTTVVTVTPPSACSNGGGAITYCASESAFPWHDWVAGVTLENLDNSSGKSPYSDFTGLTANVTTGQSYPLELTAGYSWFTYKEHWKVWIDYNQNGTFEEPNEIAYSKVVSAPPNGTLELTIYGTLNIPSTALVGLTRMRVAMKRDADPAPCETLPNGEVEDYTINISAARPENETGNRALLMQLDAMPGTDHINLTAIIGTTANAATWQLEKSLGGSSFESFRSGSIETVHDYLMLREQDLAPFEGKNVYRLRAFDRHGQLTGETMTSAQFEPLISFTIFPNPTQGEFFLELSNLEGKEVSIEIIDQLGQPVFREIIPEVSGPIHRIPPQGWRDGLYFVIVNAPGIRTKTKRLVIDRL